MAIADKVDTALVTTGMPRARVARGIPRPRFGLFVCLAPAVLFVAVMLLAPFGQTVVTSFISDALHPSFAGLDNYVRVFQDPALQRSILNTLIWVVGSLILPIGIGLAVAVGTQQMRWGRWIRMPFLIPCALSGVAVGTVGRFILVNDGALNQAIAALGFPGFQPQWLLEWPMNTIVSILVGTWQSIGVVVMLFMVGLQGVPQETIEAAALDGAEGFTRFRHIIFPQLRPVTMVVVGLTLAGALRTFDIVWVLTQGGPGRSSETLGLSIYRSAFELQQPALAAALAVLLTIVVLASSWLYLRNESGAVK